MSLTTIANVAAAECVRQQADERALVRLLQAHLYAMDTQRLPGLADAQAIGLIVEPDYAKLRHKPVIFASGGSAVEPREVGPAMVRLFDHLDYETDPGTFTKAFLDIHPFADGNGRTAWVLYNWLARTLDEPRPLPDYYGQDTAA